MAIACYAEQHRTVHELDREIVHLLFVDENVGGTDETSDRMKISVFVIAVAKLLLRSSPRETRQILEDHWFLILTHGLWSCAQNVWGEYIRLANRLNEGG